MTRDQIQQHTIEALASVAPEVDAESLLPDVPLRDQVDLDSMDFLRFVIALHTALGLDVPEADYPRLTTLSRAIDYLSERLGAPAT
jgi:acyl carrier protein